jgi:hypothetical protein
MSTSTTGATNNDEEVSIASNISSQEAVPLMKRVAVAWLYFD